MLRVRFVPNLSFVVLILKHAKYFKVRVLERDGFRYVEINQTLGIIQRIVTIRKQLLKFKDNIPSDEGSDEDRNRAADGRIVRVSFLIEVKAHLMAKEILRSDPITSCHI